MNSAFDTRDFLRSEARRAPGQSHLLHELRNQLGVAQAGLTCLRDSELAPEAREIVAQAIQALREAGDLSRILRAQQDETPLEALSLPTAASGRKLVLVVQPREALRTVMLRVLSVVGYEAEGCASGAEAEDLLGTGQRFDLALIDTVLPDTTGPMLERRLRRIAPQQRAILVAGDGPIAADPFSAHQQPPVLHKPFGAQSLIEAVAETLTNPATN